MNARHTFTVSPDFNTRCLSGWFIFNTWLQKALDTPIHFEVHDDFESQRSAITAQQIDLIYANPYDAASLIRQYGFIPVALPEGRPDEAVIVARKDLGAAAIEDLSPGIRVASTDDPDVHMMGMIMLEPADLDSGNIELTRRDNYVLVAKDLLKGQADIGFFLAETFDELSATIQGQLQVLVRSQISVIQHMFLIAPAMKAHAPALQGLLTGMRDNDRERLILDDIGIPAWQAAEREDAEFMIDLMDTLVD